LLLSFLISLFWSTVLCLSGAQPPFALEVSCTLIFFCFAGLQLHPLWELEAPIGSLHQYKLLTWIRFKNLILLLTVWGHLRTTDQDFTFPLCYPTCLIHTLHSLQYLNHQNITLLTPVTFFVLVCAQNSHGCCSPCLQSSFTRVIKKFWSPSSFAYLEHCHHQLNLRAAATRQQDTSTQERARAPFLGRM
jgi:hypothetical protein